MMREWPIFKQAWLHVKNLVFSNTRYPKYPMILKINRVRIGYWKIFRVRVGYRVPVGPCSQVNPHVALQWSFSGHMFVELKTFICPEIYIRVCIFNSAGITNVLWHSLHLLSLNGDCYVHQNASCYPLWLCIESTKMVSIHQYVFFFCAQYSGKNGW